MNRKNQIIGADIAAYIDSLTEQEKADFGKRLKKSCERAAKKAGQPNNPFLNGSIFNF